MSPLTELGVAVRIRRSDMGLTQAGLARISGLSRATVNQVETGTIADLSIKRAGRLLEALGLSMTIDPPRVKRRGVEWKKMAALDLAANVASVSHRLPLTANRLRGALTDGMAPAGFAPHLYTLLDEAPVSLLAAVAEQMHVEGRIERARSWTVMREMARSLKSSRPLWQ